MSTIFRLKFAYKYQNDNGEVKKAKTEAFAECETYTDAEKLVYAIVEQNGWGQFGLPEYEIIKTKYKVKDFIDNKVTCEDTYGNDLEGRVECYFSKDNDGFFVIKVKFIHIDENTGKEKYTSQVFVVAEESINSAIVTLRNYLRRSMTDFIIVDSKLDPAENIYLFPESYTSIVERYEA